MLKSQRKSVIADAPKIIKEFGIFKVRERAGGYYDVWASSGDYGYPGYQSGESRRLSEIIEVAKDMQSRFKSKDSSDIVGKDAVEDGTYEFITIKNGETDSTFIKARSQEEAMAIFRNNNRAGKLLEYGVWKGGRYRAFGDSLDSQSTEKMAQLKYDELNKKLKALENKIKIIIQIII